MLRVGVDNLSALDVKRVALAGEFDLFDKARVQSLLSEMLTGSTRAVVVDLSNVTYMEEAGVETLIHYLRELSKIGACMAVIVKPESRLMAKFKRLGIFEGTGLKVFGSVREVEAAIKSGECKQEKPQLDH